MSSRPTLRCRRTPCTGSRPYVFARSRGYTASILTVVRVFSLLGFGSASQPLGSRRQDDSRIDGRVDA